MFDKFSDEAIKVIMHAQEEARILKHKYVGPEHLLLGVVASDAGCVPQDHFSLSRFNLKSLREAVAKVHKKGTKASPKELPFDKDAQAVLLRSYENSKHNVIYANHIFMALLNAPDFENGFAMRVLKELNIELNNVRLPVTYQTCFGQSPIIIDGFEITQEEAKELCRDVSKIIFYAMDETRRLKQNFVGTEMILLGLLIAKGSVAGVLEGFGITLSETRNLIEKLIGPGSEMLMVEVPFTPRARKLLKIAQEEANKMGAESLDTRHLLLGFTHEQDGVAWQVLREKGVDLTALRESVLALFEETR
ncbi:MAG: hypothetical protein DKT66_09170 [Candidatus Melainabacteria bacterium]|nr:MAG: hypothetical protein DKT66_09170 [Candidatus Melainabacteria bacterium]